MISRPELLSRGFGSNSEEGIYGIRTLLHPAFIVAFIMTGLYFDIYLVHFTINCPFFFSKLSRVLRMDFKAGSEISAAALSRITGEQTPVAAVLVSDHAAGGSELVPLENREEAHLSARHEHILRHNYDIEPLV